MQNTLTRELEAALQLDERGLVSPAAALHGFVFAQTEMQQIQESVPSDVFSLENNTSILQTLVSPDDTMHYRVEQHMDILHQCYQYIQAQTIASKINTYPYADGSTMVDVYQYHNCDFNIANTTRTVSAFAAATLYISGIPTLSVVFALII